MALLRWGLLLSLLCLVASQASEITVGNVRVQALSETLLRIEPIGPRGFEDRTTMMVQGRSEFPGIPISLVNSTDVGTWVGTSAYQVFIQQNNSLPANCSAVLYGNDAVSPERSATYPLGYAANDQDDCCRACQEDPQCHAWVYAPSSVSDPKPGDVPGCNCWPLFSYAGQVEEGDRVFGCLDGCVSPILSLTVTDLQGNLLYEHVGQPDQSTNLLNWPSPLSGNIYALTDYPRFFVPSWGPTPVPSNQTVDPALVATNGYDFRNNQNGDLYVFLLGNTMDSWHASRRDFLTLTGPVPILPDYAYGTWFTWWHSFTESHAMSNVTRWNTDNLPLDVWGLDMNWRNTSNDQDHFYNHPNTALFPNFPGWFTFLQQNKLRTYFNDHPFPVDMQTSPKEVAFRAQGLQMWLQNGIDFWWFDHNWAFSIPAPNMYPVGGWGISLTSGVWQGLDNAAWGSHLYHTTVKEYNLNNRGGSPRPMTLTKYGLPDYRAGDSAGLAAESPAHHRYPVWWTGDGVDLEGSIESMVQAGVHHLKPFVHSDCGGDSRGTAGDLLRWTGHCTFGTILRFHGSDHRPWSYDSGTENTIRNYLNLRYKLIPSMIAAGQTASTTGFPIVARGDFFWPGEVGAASNLQYLHLNNTLVAPIYTFMGLREVWIPPGSWQDAWSGEVLAGPQNVIAKQPDSQTPMWHQRGGLMVMAHHPSLRVDLQDWSTLTLEAFPHFAADATAERTLYALGSAARTHITMRTNVSDTSLHFEISKAEDGATRAWYVRLHLLPGQSIRAIASTTEAELPRVFLLPPHESDKAAAAAGFFPFAGAGTRPAPRAGPVAEVHLATSQGHRQLSVSIH